MKKEDNLKLAEIVLVALACPLIIPAILDNKTED